MATATEITTTTDILPLITATTTAITATDAVEGAQQHDSGTKSVFMPKLRQCRIVPIATDQTTPTET